MNCPIFLSHAPRKDGSCSRYHLCATQGILYAGKIGGSIDKTDIISFPITEFPDCKAVMVTGFSVRRKMEVRRMAKKTKTKKKTIKREAKGTETAAMEQEIGTQATTPESKEEKGPIVAVTEDQILAAMKTMEGEITSTRLRDQFGTTRSYIRRAMKKLQDDKKVIIELKGKKQQVYKLA